MTTKPIYLRQARKRKQRADKAKQAEANRVEHGTPRALREPVQLERQRLLRDVDGKKRVDPTQDQPGSETPEA